MEMAEPEQSAKMVFQESHLSLRPITLGHGCRQQVIRHDSQLTGQVTSLKLALFAFTGQFYVVGRMLTYEKCYLLCGLKYSCPVAIL